MRPHLGQYAPRAGEGPMRVLHVITTIGIGGAEHHLIQLMRDQVSAGLEVGLAYLKGDGLWVPRLQEIGVTVRCLGLQRYGEPAPAVRLRRFIRAFRPALVHAHMPPAELYARVAMLGIRQRFLPLVVTKHNDEPFYRGWGSALTARWVARRADHVIAISSAVRRYVTGPTVGISLEKTAVVRYGIDADRYPATLEEGAHLREEWGIGPGEYLIGTVARLTPQKALHHLIDAFAQYCGEAGRRARLVVVGIGPLEADLRRRADRAGVAENVIWGGHRRDVPAVMAAIDAFVLSSLYEGFGLVLLEAMASGNPVVATRVSAIPEIVRNGETGILVPPGEPEALAGAIRRLEDSRERRRLGEAALRRVRDEFGTEKVMYQTLNVYNKVLGRPAVGSTTAPLEAGSQTGDEVSFTPGKRGI